jgi:hypothetical protein
LAPILDDKRSQVGDLFDRSVEDAFAYLGNGAFVLESPPAA